MRTVHYDAAGKECHDWMTLKTEIQHKPSQELLRRFMLFQLLVIPAVEIRVPTPFYGAVEVHFYGTGRVSCNTREISENSLKKLRAFYKRCWKCGWSTHVQKGYVAFRREARVMRDPLRRYS